MTGHRRSAILISALAWFALGSFAAAQSRVPASTPVTAGPVATAPASTSASAPPSTANSSAPATAPSTTAPADLLIGAGDLLEVSVYGAPDFEKKEARVSSDGNISLPLIAAVHVAGLTASQAERLIAEKLVAGGYFVQPAVSVFDKEYATQGVSVLGEVQKPGVYPLLGPRRLFDAISMAGGLTPKAGSVATVAHRDQPDHPITVKLANNTTASTDGDIEIAPGDTIVVAKAGIIYVVGDVKMPGGFVMENGRLTVLQAIALAQGVNPTASLSKGRLIHTVDGKRQEAPLDVKLIFASKAPDPLLQPEDIVFIPNSAAKSTARRSLDVILQTATGVAIYR
jgi:polysaccharide export outer membrane protein